MGRRRVEIKPIEEKSKQHTTFSKWRSGLFKKTEQLCRMCDVQAAAIAFSKAGKISTYGHPSVDVVLSRYFAEPTSFLAKELVNDEEGVHGGGPSGVKKEEEPPLTETEKKIAEAMRKGKPAWETTVENLELSELNELEAAVMKIKSKLKWRSE